MSNYPIHYRTLQIGDLDIFYREAGPDDAPVLLLLHGFPTSSHMFRNLLPLLKHRYRLIAPDYPGFGYSSFPLPDVFDYTFDNLSRIMEKFIDGLGLSRFSLYIQDYGAPVGLRIVTRRPELLACLIVQNANTYSEGIGPLFDPIIALWEEQSEENKQKVMDLFELPVTRFQYEEGTTDKSRISPDTYYLDQALMDRPYNKQVQLALQYDYRTNPPEYPRWQQLFRQKQPPTLVVWGDNDPFFTRQGALAYQKDISRIEYHFYPSGHFVLEEFGEDIAGKIDAFLSTHLSN
jgi:pimeloyl-ACP methyl ester carboxylesterase